MRARVRSFLFFLLVFILLLGACVPPAAETEESVDLDASATVCVLKMW